MPEQPEDKKTPHTLPDKKSHSHISEVTYGLGSASAGGILFGMGAAVTSFVTLYFGRQKSETIRKSGDFIEKLPNMARAYIKKQLPENLQGSEGHLAAAIAVAGVVFVFGKRIAEIPAFFRGKYKAKEINLELKHLQNENAELKAIHSSGDNKGTVTKFTESAEKRSPAFTEALQQQEARNVTTGVSP